MSLDRWESRTEYHVVVWAAVPEALSGPAGKVLGAIGHAPSAGRGHRQARREGGEGSFALERHFSGNMIRRGSG
jgi:hypothetical protein